MSSRNRLILGDCLDVARTLPDASFGLIYLDPPFNTGTTRSHARISVARADAARPDSDTEASGQAPASSDAGGPTRRRRGFAGREYVATTRGEKRAYADAFDDYTGWLAPRLREAHRVLAPHGTLYFHIDYREAAYCKVLLDSIFGRDRFINEVVWAYDYGGRTRRRWPAKHDDILVYVKDPKRYVFNHDALDRIPYMAPGLVTPEKAARGKTPTDVWWQTIVPTSGPERTGYPTQKPLAILTRIVLASSRPGDAVLDMFCGSGTTGVAAAREGRSFTLIDSSPEAVEVSAARLDRLGIVYQRGGDCDNA